MSTVLKLVRKHQIVAAVISALDLRIPLAEAEVARTRPVDKLDAWSLYYLGLSHMFQFNGHDNAHRGRPVSTRHNS